CARTCRCAPQFASTKAKDHPLGGARTQQVNCPTVTGRHCSLLSPIDRASFPCRIGCHAQGGRSMNTRRGFLLAFRVDAAALCAWVLVAIAVLGASTNVWAATISWTGAVNADWSNPQNWDPPGTPAAGDVLAFPAGTSNTSMNNDLASGTVFTSLI